MERMESRQYVFCRRNLLSFVGKNQPVADRLDIQAAAGCGGHYCRGVDCGIAGQPGVQRLGLPADAVFLFGADMPAVFGAVVFPVGACCTDL